MPIKLGVAYKKPKPIKLMANGVNSRCQHQTHKGGKPGTWVQCRFSVKDGNRKYCSNHSS